MLKQCALSAAVLLLSISLMGCEDKELDDLAKAQDCLDKVSDANYASAETCLSYVAKYDSQQANIIKCSGKFLAGGLTTSKIVDAYKEYEDADAGASKDGIFIGYLALTPSSKAKEAAPFCRKTGVDGFIYLAELAVVGSVMGSIGGVDFTDGVTEAELTTIANTCQATPANCEPEVLAEAATNLAESYCASPSAETDDVCQDINSTISQANGNNDEIAKALTCFLSGKTYANGTCS